MAGSNPAPAAPQSPFSNQDNPPVAGPGPDATNAGGKHPSILFSDIVGAVQFGMAQGHAGDAPALISGEIGPFSAQIFGVPDPRLPAGINLIVDTDEKGMPVSFKLTFQPSPITVARLQARAKIVEAQLISEAQELLKSLAAT